MGINEIRAIVMKRSWEVKKATGMSLGDAMRLTWIAVKKEYNYKSKVQQKQNKVVKKAEKKLTYDEAVKIVMADMFNFALVA